MLQCSFLLLILSLAANAICQPADFFFHVYYYHFQVLLDTYYFKVPFDVKAIVSVAKKMS